MRIGEVAQQLGVSTSTVRNYSRSGRLSYTIHQVTKERCYKQEDVDAFLGRKRNEITAFYVRSSSGDKNLIQGQIDELSAVFGKPDRVFKDSGSGLNEHRKGLSSLLQRAAKGEFTQLCVTYKDRLSRFGVEYLQLLLNEYGVSIKVLHDEQKVSSSEELMRDFMSLIASFSGKFYRLRGKDQQKQLISDAEKRLNETE